MIIYITEHCKKQLKKRKPEKNLEWLKAIFHWMMDAYNNKWKYQWHDVYIKSKFWKYWPIYKIICWKYWIVYSRLSSNEYNFITFLTREWWVKVNGKTYWIN